MKKIKLTILSAALLAASSTVFAATPNTDLEDDHIYIYKDAGGSMIYSDKLPVKKGVPVKVLSKKTGIVRTLEQVRAFAPKKNKKVDEPVVAEVRVESEEEKELKKSQYLLGTYSSVQEIEKIKNYELDQITRSIENDNNIIATLKDRRATVSENMNKTKDSKELADYSLELNRIESQIETSRSNIEKNKRVYSDREKKYDNEKAQFEKATKILQKRMDEQAARMAAPQQAPINKADESAAVIGVPF